MAAGPGAGAGRSRRSGGGAPARRSHPARHAPAPGGQGGAGAGAGVAGSVARHDFDPFGDDHTEHRSDVGRVLDDDPGTSWTTERYTGGLQTKPGSGSTSTPSRVSLASSSTSAPRPRAGRARSTCPTRSSVGDRPVGLEGPRHDLRRRQEEFSLQLDTAGQKFRYYLVWITKRRPRARRRSRRSCSTSDARRTVKLTHPDRVLWPDAGLTKRDLYDYFGAVAETMLPHVRDRPVSLQRFRGAVGEGGIFQKEVPKGAPEWVADGGGSQARRSRSSRPGSRPRDAPVAGPAGLRDAARVHVAGRPP